MSYNVSNRAILEAIVSVFKDEVVFMNVSHWRVTGLAGPNDGRLVMAAFDSGFNIAGGYQDTLMNCLPDSAICLNVSYQWIWPVRYAYRSFTPSSLLGHVAQPSLPSTTCLAVQRTTDEAGRSNRGEFHIGPVPTTFVANSVKTAAADAGYAPFLAKCIDPIVTLAEQFDPVLFHRSAPDLSKVPTQSALMRTSRALHRRTVGVGI
jgi:hypothetical protein